MDQNLADNAQDVDIENEAGQAIQDCLCNTLIVRTILKHFSSTELLQMAFVNKLWKSEARSLVNQRGNLIAYLVNGSVAAFVSDLPQLGAAPFSGIMFNISYPHGNNNVCSFTPEDLVRIQAIDQLSFTNVSVIIAGRWKKFRNCPAFLLAKKVLQKFCEDLEEFELSVRVKQEDYIKEVIQDCSFPRLEILKVSCYEFMEYNDGYMRALLSRAPNLKLLRADWNMNSALRFLQGTSVEFVYPCPVAAPFDEIPDTAISAIRFEWMELKYTDSGFNFERFNRIAPILLQASRTTLHFMPIDAVLAVPLMCYGARLENVKILRMDIDYSRMESIEPRILRIVKNFDFTRIFPKLDEVTIFPLNDYQNGFAPEHINAFIERANAVLTEPLLDRAARIKKLSAHRWQPTCEAAQFFLEMFPNIEKLEITADSRRPMLFGCIWQWLNLSELKVKGNMLPTTGNLDSVFCGIFPEEVAQLKLKDDEYLKKVNIVPVMPAVTCLRNLRTINLHHWHNSEQPIFDDDATFMFSKVTALVAFARQPGLAVSLKILSLIALPAMNHLKPYVSVTCDRLGR